MRASDTVANEVDNISESAIAEPELSDIPPAPKTIDLSLDSEWTKEVLPEEQKKDKRRLGFWHDVLVHRYDYEVGRMNNLKSQSTFILGAVGLVVTLGVTLCTADRFSLSYVYQIPTCIIVFAAISLLIAVSCALLVFIRLHSWGYCLAYPSDRHIFGKLDATYCSPADLNLDLVKIIKRNSKKNDLTVRIMWVGQWYFVLGITITFLIGALLLYMYLTSGGSDAVINAANVTINVVNTSILPM